jgi:4-hydroxy-tetrahydrodipicolinate synthase
MMSRDEIRAALTGPIASVNTPFCRDGSLDLDGLRRFIDYVISAGTRTVLLTYGDSLFTLLTDDEVAQVTRVAVEHTAGRAMVVAADRAWATPKTVEFAKYCSEIGADVLMVLPPDWAASCTRETLVEHYAAVAEHMSVMVVTAVFGTRQALGLRVLEDLVNQVDNVVAIKDDVCNEFGRKMALICHERCAVFAGGQKQHHMNLLPYGCDGYMSVYIKMKPSIAHTYWNAIQSGDLTKAVEVIRQYDFPYFGFIADLPGGFDSGEHGALEIYGIAGRWRRKPYYSLSDEELDRLRGFLQGLGVA